MEPVYQADRGYRWRDNSVQGLPARLSRQSNRQSHSALDCSPASGCSLLAKGLPNGLSVIGRESNEALLADIERAVAAARLFDEYERQTDRLYFHRNAAVARVALHADGLAGRMEDWITAPPERWIFNGLGQNSDKISAAQILCSERPGDVSFTACAFIGFHDRAAWNSARTTATRPAREGSRRRLPPPRESGAMAAKSARRIQPQRSGMSQLVTTPSLRHLPLHPLRLRRLRHRPNLRRPRRRGPRLRPRHPVPRRPRRRRLLPTRHLDL